MTGRDRRVIVERRWERALGLYGVDLASSLRRTPTVRRALALLAVRAPPIQ